MLSEKILGKLSDPAFAGCRADYVDIEWHEAYKKLHQKKTASALKSAFASAMRFSPGDFVRTMCSAERATPSWR